MILMKTLKAFSPKKIKKINIPRKSHSLKKPKSIAAQYLWMRVKIQISSYLNKMGFFKIITCENRKEVNLKILNLMQQKINFKKKTHAMSSPLMT